MATINLTGLIEGGGGASVSTPTLMESRTGLFKSDPGKSSDTAVFGSTIMGSRTGLFKSDPGKSSDTVVFGSTIMGSRTGIITRKLADTGSGADSGADSGAGSGVVVSKESWS